MLVSDTSKSLIEKVRMFWTGTVRSASQAVQGAGYFAFPSLLKRGDVAARRRYPCIACGPNAQNDFDVEVEDDEERAWAVRDDLKLAMVNKCPPPPPLPATPSLLSPPCRPPPVHLPPGRCHCMRSAILADPRKAVRHQGRLLPRVIATATDTGCPQRFLSRPGWRLCALLAVVGFAALLRAL